MRTTFTVALPNGAGTATFYASPTPREAAVVAERQKDLIGYKRFVELSRALLSTGRRVRRAALAALWKGQDPPTSPEVEAKILAWVQERQEEDDDAFAWLDMSATRNRSRFLAEWEALALDVPGAWKVLADVPVDPVDLDVLWEAWARARDAVLEGNAPSSTASRAGVEETQGPTPQPE